MTHAKPRYDELAAEAVEDGRPLDPDSFNIVCLRPDGWWVAGSGFESEADAREAATTQLPDYVIWDVVNGRA